MFRREVRGGIGGGSDDEDLSLFDDDVDEGLIESDGKQSVGESVGDELSLLIVPLMAR